MCSQGRSSRVPIVMGHVYQRYKIFNLCLQDILGSKQEPSTSLLDAYHLEDKVNARASSISGHVNKKSSSMEEVNMKDASSVNSILIVSGVSLKVGKLELCFLKPQLLSYIW